MNPFHDAATRVACGPVLDWKASGRPAVGYTCSYTPPELFYAMDILPVRLRGIETEGTDVADTYFGPFICSFPKCILQLAGKGKYAFLDGAVITPGCDSMRRLDECWRKAGEDISGILPDYFYYFDVPHKAELHGRDWYLEELRLLIQSLETHFHREITDAGLRAAIKVYNKARRLLGEVEDLRAGREVPVSGADVFAAAIAGVVMPRDDYTALLEAWVEELKTRGRDLAAGKARLMLLGSISDEIDLLNLIEGSGKAIVVAENLCFGVRSEGREIDESGDPIPALADHYLGDSLCPRMYGKYKERQALLEERIQKAGVQGVVLQNIRFCDLHGAENALLERDLEAMGIPCLRIEREYGPHIDVGRMKIRINAFLERMAVKK